jgi:hypothetical protein
MSYNLVRIEYLFSRHKEKLNIYVLGVGTTVRSSGLFCERRAGMGHGCSQGRSQR